MRTSRPRERFPAWTQYAIPPHNRAGHEHRGGRKSEHKPNGLRGRVTESSAAPRNPSPAKPPEVQVGKPIQNAIDDALARVCWRQRLKIIRDVLKQILVSKIGSGDPEQQDESQAPEAHHAM